MPATENSAASSGSDRHRRQQARQREVAQGIDGQRIEGVDLLGDGHVADGGRHRLNPPAP